MGEPAAANPSASSSSDLFLFLLCARARASFMAYVNESSTKQSLTTFKRRRFSHEVDCMTLVGRRVLNSAERSNNATSQTTDAETPCTVLPFRMAGRLLGRCGRGEVK